MGATGISLEVTGDGNRKYLFGILWRLIRKVVTTYVDDAVYEQLKPYFISATDYESWGVDPHDGSLNFMFSDFAGNTARSKYLWTHWSSIAIAKEWDAIVAVARKHGLEVTSPRRRLQVGGDDGFIELRGNVWLIQEDRLWSDGSESIEIAALDAEERARVEAARTSCACGVCTMMQPDKVNEKLVRAEGHLIDQLVDPDRAAKAAQQLTQLPAPPSLRALLALISANLLPRQLRPLVEQYAHRGIDGAWDAVFAALPTYNARTRGTALYALACSHRTTEQTTWLLDKIHTALTSEDDEMACALAEVAGRMNLEGPNMALALSSVLDREFIDERMRLAAVDGLSALSDRLKPMPSDVRDRLRRESERGGDAASAAAALLQLWS